MTKKVDPHTRVAELQAMEDFLAAGKTTVCPDGAAAGTPTIYDDEPGTGLLPVLSRARNRAPHHERQASLYVQKAPIRLHRSIISRRTPS